MMEPILAPFRELFKGIKLGAPKIPFLSNLTGTWIEPAQATDPDYWSKQLRHTVRFSDGLGELLKTPNRTLLEVGPGRTLGSLSKQHPAKSSDQLVLSSFGYSKGKVPELGEVMTTLGRLWIAGAPVDWLAASAGQKRRRISLPTYPFERKRYWIDAKNSAAARSNLDLSSLDLLKIHAGSSDEANIVRASDFDSPSNQNLHAPVDDRAQCTDLQTVVASVWREVLGFEKIGIDEDFFDLGGDSLLSGQVVSRLRTTFRIDLPTSCLFEARTVAELASYMVAHEPKPGLVEKTAVFLLQIENMTDEELLQASARA
jgi:acyl transferase domain-containing protein